jgi:hypothetical protein
MAVAAMEPTDSDMGPEARDCCMSRSDRIILELTSLGQL